MPETRTPVPTEVAGPLRTLELEITGMTCSSCVSRVEKKLGRLDGVDASVNLALETATVHVPAGVSDQQVVETVEKAGYGAVLKNAPGGDDAGGPDTPAYAAAARVPDPAGLPPAYIEVGQLDVFRDEDLNYAMRLGQAGVPVEFHLHPGVPHEFEFFAFDSAVARRVIADRVRALASL